MSQLYHDESTKKSGGWDVFVRLVVALYRWFMGFLGSIIDVLVIVIVISLNIYVSWNHTLALFRSAGLSQEGFLDIASVCAVELVFIYSSSKMLFLRATGRFPSWKEVRQGESLGIVLTSLMGVGLITWSNVLAGIPYGVKGVIVEIVIPLSIILGEWCLADGVKARMRKRMIPATNTEKIEAGAPIIKPEPIPEENQTPTNEDTKNEPELVPEPIPELNQELHQAPTRNEPEPIPELNQELHQEPTSEDTKAEDENQPEPIPELTPELHQEPTNEDTKNEPELVPEPIPELTPELNQETNQTVYQDLTRNEPEPIPELNQTVYQDLTRNEPELTPELVPEPTKKTAKRSTTLSDKLLDPSTIKLKRAAKKWAIKYYKENRKPPGRAKIEKEFGASQNIAREVAAEVKKELGIKVS